MELNLSQETILINEIIFKGVLEQGVESDYVLPDYLPDIIRVLKSKIIPKITSKQTSGDKVIIDGYNLIKFFYLSEDLKKINSIDIKIPFSKTQDIKNTIPNIYIDIKATTDYCNCRVINQRRIDIRGAISIFLSIETRKNDDVITNIDGADIEMLKKNIETSKMLGIIEKQFSQSEDFDLSNDEADIDTIIKTSGYIEISDIKLITNKIILKGNIDVDILCQGKSDYLNIFTIKKSLLFSQILEMDGIDDLCICDIKATPISIDAEISNYGNEEEISLSINANLYLIAKGYLKTQTSVILDAYSTKFENQISIKELTAEQISEMINESSSAKETLDLNYEEIEKVIDISGEIENVTYKYDKPNIILNGNIIYNIIGVSSAGEISYIEKNTEFEISRPIKDNAEMVNFDGDIIIKNVSVSSFMNNMLDIKTEISLKGTVLSIFKEKIISKIEVDFENNKKEKARSSLVIYFADKNENLWEIAKSHNTSKQGIIDENNLETEKLIQRQMLLIPTA